VLKNESLRLRIVDYYKVLTLIGDLLMVVTKGVMYKGTVSFCASWQPRVCFVRFEVTDFGLG